MLFFLLSLIAVGLTDIPDCPPGPDVTQEECLSVPGCFFDGVASNKIMCLVQCNAITNNDDCKLAHECYWNEEHEACSWIYDCSFPKSEEKCSYHPKDSLSCIWDASESDKDPHCRTMRCFDYNSDPILCNADDNLECSFEKNYCRNLQCPDFRTIVDCHNAVGHTCAWQNNLCVQVPCPQWTTAGDCIDFGFCRWHNDTKTCVKALCEDLSHDQTACENYYAEKYIGPCAWDGTGCHSTHDCQLFSTKLGCLVGGGACIWADDRCVGM